MSTAPLTHKQRLLLEAVQSCRRPATGPVLADLLGVEGTEGLHMTAASLVRRGLIVKTKTRGIVHYTAAG